MSYLSRKNPNKRRIRYGLVTIGSAFLCLLLAPTRLPGMEILGIGPNWLLIWVVASSVKGKVWQGILIGIIFGLLQDSMTYPLPSHAFGLALVGGFTSALHKQRYIKEDFISIAFIVFLMAAIAETVMAIQFSIARPHLINEIWYDWQRIALCSAILSSLWTPVIYLPLNWGWELNRN